MPQVAVAPNRVYGAPRSHREPVSPYLTVTSLPNG